jgi:hypothetical protein
VVNDCSQLTAVGHVARQRRYSVRFCHCLRCRARGHSTQNPALCSSTKSAPGWHAQCLVSDTNAVIGIQSNEQRGTDDEYLSPLRTTPGRLCGVFGAAQWSVSRGGRAPSGTLVRRISRIMQSAPSCGLAPHGATLVGRLSRWRAALAATREHLAASARSGDAPPRAGWLGH